MRPKAEAAAGDSTPVTRLRASMLAAALAGVAILLAFFVWHWFRIAPVWTVLAEGVVGVLIAGAAVGWAWTVSRDAGRFASRAGGLAFGGVFAAGLVGLEILGLARGPQPDPTTAAAIAKELAFVLIPTAALVVAGWRLARGWKGAAAYGAASLVLLVYLGGSVAHRGGVGLGLELFLVLLPGYLVAGAVVGWADRQAATPIKA